MESSLKKFTCSVGRTKVVDLSRVTDTKLARCLSALDLTALGIGSTLGAGIYVVAGQVARTTAGPSVILSFLIAAIASIFAGLCYAEFGARVPKTGSAYVYSYITVGELWAFTIGWNLILEYVIGTASVARAWSAYFDSIIGGQISAFFSSMMPIHIEALSSYPDFFAFGITLLLTLVLCVGVKESSILNNVFTALNLLVVLYIVICGLFKVDFNNWAKPAEEVPQGFGSGGFFPYGMEGTLAGAATCFYAFIGFDVIATTGEEVRNPQKAIPIAIVVSLLMCFLAYFGVSSVLTLMVPYYSINGDAPLPQMFEEVGWEFARYLIAVGAICGLSTSLLGAMFPMPRVIYAMAEDGLLFGFFTHVPERVKTPVIATIVAGVLAATMSLVFDLEQLVEMMSIGTLLAYTLVAACVLILRYRVTCFKTNEQRHDEAINSQCPVFTTGLCPGPSGSDYVRSRPAMADPVLPSGAESMPVDILETPSESTDLLPSREDFIKQLLGHKNDPPTDFTECVAKACIGIMVLTIISLCAFLVFCGDNVGSLSWWAITVVVILGLVIVILLLIIWRQPQNVDFLTFQVPAVPLIPALSMLVNIFLMMKLSGMTWVRFAVWLAIGYIIYFTYGIWHSKERQHRHLEEHDPVSQVEEGERIHQQHLGTELPNTKEYK